MTWKRLSVNLAFVTGLALIELVTDKDTWTNTGMSGYVSIALPFAAYLTGTLVAFFRDRAYEQKNK